MPTISDLLSSRVRALPSAPLLTWFEEPAGLRTELSARTFANWVDKTANLIGDELELGEGDRIRLEVLTTRPGHWMSLVWVQAAWRTGVEIVLAGPADAAVTGPEPGAAREIPTLACSLHPLGMGLRDLPAGVIDYATEVRLQPDAFFGTTPAPTAPAWPDPAYTLTGLTVLTPEARRVLIVPTDPWHTVRSALVEPLLGGGSAVLVEGTPGPDRLAAIRAAELVEADK
ncbi:TIGR03089 family protein [Granulicoccus phenolivorans]|uniref:TIGR03089 family protein n=1 Tax=Granulicoccus phenolivorans TaxID=266854 RepID=UPI00138ACE42|nr:TIGR03089 family protein [Granulicoccus phenolivorans]